MIKVRKSKERGYANHGWLRSFHSFSFADYYDPAHMGHSVLRVINEDYIAAAQGFPTHGHQNMEIVTYVISGAIEHRDSLGNGGIIEHGEIQRMSAGTGIRHSEFNPKKDQETHMLQIWILPDRAGHEPGYEQVQLKDKMKLNSLTLIASPNKENESLLIHQNAKIFAGQFEEKQKITLPVCASRSGWLQLISGELEVSGQILNAGDAVAIFNEEAPSVVAKKDAHFLFFDLP